MPFILRKAVSKTGEPFHKLVGECFIDGLMDGEAVDAMREQRVHWGPFSPKPLLERLYAFPSLKEDGRQEMKRMMEECIDLNQRSTKSLASVMVELR
jgi:hypothetical protein